MGIGALNQNQKAADWKFFMKKANLAENEPCKGNMLLRFGYTHLITIEKDQFTNEKEEKKMIYWLRENKTKRFYDR